MAGTLLGPLQGHVRQPLSRFRTVVARCKPSDKSEKEKDGMVKEAVEQLRKADVTQEAAREMMKMWREVRFLQSLLARDDDCMGGLQQVRLLAERSHGRSRRAAQTLQGQRQCSNWPLHHSALPRRPRVLCGAYLRRSSATTQADRQAQAVAQPTTYACGPSSHDGPAAMLALTCCTGRGVDVGCDLPLP